MKKVLLLIFIILSDLPVYCQLNTQINIGLSSYPAPVGGLQIQYRFHPVFVQVGYDAHLNRKVKQGNYINGGVGIYKPIGEFFIEPYVGYSYILRTSDKPDLNEWKMIYGLSIGKDINDGSLVLKTLYCRNIYFLLVGMRYNF